jgi:hypothetical protein
MRLYGDLLAQELAPTTDATAIAHDRRRAEQ